MTGGHTFWPTALPRCSGASCQAGMVTPPAAGAVAGAAAPPRPPPPREGGSDASRFLGGVRHRRVNSFSIASWRGRGVESASWRCQGTSSCPCPGRVDRAASSGAAAAPRERSPHPPLCAADGSAQALLRSPAGQTAGAAVGAACGVAGAAVCCPNQGGPLLALTGSLRSRSWQRCARRRGRTNAHRAAVEAKNAALKAAYSSP
eukprot:364383-Chlamydomonas_euryale.AAC.3